MVKRIVLVLGLLAFSAPASAAFLDVCLRITDTKAEARAALRTLGLDREMLRRDEAGKLVITTANHHVAIELWRRPILQFAVRDASASMVASVSDVLS